MVLAAVVGSLPLRGGVDEHMGTVTDSPNLEESLFKAGLKPAIFIGTVLGVIPRNSGFAKLTQQSKPKRWTCLRWILLLHSLLLMSVAVMNALLKVTKYFVDVRNFISTGRNFMEKLGESIHIAYPCAVAFAYLSQLYHAKHFEVVIGKLYAGIRELGPGCFGKRPYSFLIFCWFITLICLFFGVGENIWFDMQSYALANQKSATMTVPLFYYDALHNWHFFIPTYSPIATLMLLVPLKITNYGWVFLDAVVILLCYVLSCYFKWLHETIQIRLVQRPQSLHNGKVGAVKVQIISLGKSTDSFTWEKALQLYWLLEDLTYHVEKYIAPLVLACYVCIGHILIILFAWIAPDIPVSLSTSNSEIIMFSWMYYCFRVGMVTYFLSQVHQSSHAILRTVERCDSAAYHLATQRLERKLAGNPVGIHLFGTFLITKYFIISMISCIVTTEVILLQIGGAIRPEK